MMWKNLLAGMLVASLQVGPGVGTVVQKAPEPVERVTGVVYVGDSRINGMEMVTNKGGDFVVAKDCMGYYWLKGTVGYRVQKLREKYPEIKQWTIVSNLGVNDLGDIDFYIEYYKKLEDLGYRVVIMSVNPTSGKRKDMNDKIDDFNSAIKDAGLEYFDMCSHLREVGFDSSDGLHYRKNTNIEIWNELNHYLQWKPEKEGEVYTDWLCNNDSIS